MIAVSFSPHRSSSRHLRASNLRLTHPWLTCFNSCNACHLRYDARSKYNMSESKFHPWRFVIAVSFPPHRTSSRHMCASNLCPCAFRQTRLEHAYEVCICDPAWIIHSAVLPRTNTKGVEANAMTFSTIDCGAAANCVCDLSLAVHLCASCVAVRTRLPGTFPCAC